MANNISDVSASEDCLPAFSSEVDREKLQEAILECTRNEVLRALNGILGKGNNNKKPRSHIPSYLESKQPKSDAPHTKRPQTVEIALPGKPTNNRRHRPKTSQFQSSNEKPIESRPLPLESIDVHTNHPPIDRSSFNLLERSSVIITKATGEPPRKFDDAFGNDGNHKLDKESAVRTQVSEVVENENTQTADDDDESCDGEEMVDGIHQTDSWPENFRPTTATRMIHTSYSVLRNKPPKRRPLTTTALERRKPPPSTATSERSKAQDFSKRLLGPITLEPKRPNYDFIVPNSLAANEWENELARNIINVFSNKARSEIKGDLPPDDVVKSSPSVIVSNSLFSNNSAFHGNGFMQEQEEDFQRISISREASGIDYTGATEFFAGNPEKEIKHNAKKTVKRDLQNGTFRLKMIWFTGTGMVQANWESINEIDPVNFLDCEDLSVLEEQGRYMRYIGIVELSILRWNSKTLHQEEHCELKQKLWRQLIITCNCFATRLIEKRKYSKAMEMLERALGFIGSELGLLPEHNCEELTAIVKDTYAYYYIRRSKPSASYQYLISAINIYKRRNDALNVAKCRLHQSFIQCAQNKYSNSMESLRKILTMVENGALDIESDYNQVLLLSSVAYHNIAVQQLMLGLTTDACVSSQNARRLARLCLNVSSHYLPMLESTHKQSLNQLSNVLKNSHNEKQASLFHNLISELFDY